MNNKATSKTSFINQGDSIKQILYYWFPEYISMMILITIPPIIDSLIISNSQTITSYGVLIMATNFLYTFTKFAEAIPVASIAIIGRFNGAKKFDLCGKELGTMLWLTFFLGVTQFVIILLFAKEIYQWLGVPNEMIAIGEKFIKLKSLSILLTFILFSFIFFMKAVKNTKIPMIINIIGILSFCFLDYSLVLGKFGFPKLNLIGSAVASVLQFIIMNSIALGYLLFNKEYKKYFPVIFFKSFGIKNAIRLLNLSWPIMIDKGSFAMCYVWLAKMIAPFGAYAIATYDVVKNLERFTFIPAMGFAQIITFLVSNKLGAKDPEGATANIKKTLIFAASFVLIGLSILCYNARYFISFFDKGGNFTEFAAPCLIAISLFAIFDIIQVVLAGALRGSGDVKAVMYIRSLTCFIFFFPFSYICSKIPFPTSKYNFVAVYSTYYITTGIMSLLFLIRIKSHKWQKRNF